MFKPFSQRLKRHRDEGSILFEALMASATLVLVAATITPLFLRHLDLARRTRDLNLVETVVNRDINAFRHFSRFWMAYSGPYSQTFLNKAITLADPSSQNNGERPMTYTPGGYCFTWNDQDYLERAMEGDANSYGNSMPGGIQITQTQGFAFRKFTEVPGYEIQRYATSVSLDGNNATAIRLTYFVQPAANSKSPPLPFSRVAEVAIDAQFWC
jgi:hypothetical protein